MRTSQKLQSRTEQASFSTIRISLESKMEIDDLLKKANTKTIGRMITARDLVDKLLDLVEDNFIKLLQATACSNRDRFERMILSCVDKHPNETVDELIGRYMDSDIDVPTDYDLEEDADRRKEKKRVREAQKRKSLETQANKQCSYGGSEVLQ